MFGRTSEIEVVLTDSFDMELTVTKSSPNLVMTHSKSVRAADLLHRSDASESPVQPVGPGNLGNHWAITGVTTDR